MATAIYLYITLGAFGIIHFLFRLCVGQYRPCRFHKLLQKQHFLGCGHKSPETVEAQSFQGFDGRTKVGYFSFDPQPHICDEAYLMRRTLLCVPLVVSCKFFWCRKATGLVIDKVSVV